MKSVRLITKIALVLLVVGFPLASWYYLNTGLEYRKQALKDLTPKGALKISEIDRTEIEFFTSVVFCDLELRDEISEIFEQYKESPTFQVIELVEKPYDSPWKTIVTQDPKFQCGDQEIYLVDTEAQLRNTYSSQIKDLGTLVEHIAMVLPREKDPDIIVKNHEGK